MKTDGTLAPMEMPFREVAPAAAAGTVFVCGLCGCRFTHGGLVCGACPISARCDLVKCPNCGFQFPHSSWVSDRLGAIWRRWMERT